MTQIVFFSKSRTLRRLSPAKQSRPRVSPSVSGFRRGSDSARVSEIKRGETAQLGGQICVNRTPPRTHISTAETARARPGAYGAHGEALAEQQHEDHDKDAAAKSDDTNLFCLTFYLTWRSGRWAVSLTWRDPRLRHLRQ